MAKFHDETSEQKKTRLMLESRRESLEFILEKYKKFHDFGSKNPDCPAWLVEELRETIEATEEFLKEDALKRNLGDVN